MSEFVAWSQEMSVGAQDLDDHHKIIINCLNELHPLLETGATLSQIQPILNKLEQFVLVHFSEEEREMKEAGFPDWERHKRQHDGMYDMVFKVKSDLERGIEMGVKDLFEMVHDWLINHILGEDKLYAPYLSNPTKPVAQWRRSNGKDV